MHKGEIVTRKIKNAQTPVYMNLHDNIWQNVKGFVVAAKKDRMAEHINAVDWEGLLRHQTVGLNLVPHRLAGQPGRACVEAVVEGGVEGGRCPDAGTVPVPELAALGAGEDVVGLVGVELDFADGRGVGREEGGGVLTTAPKVPHRHQSVLRARDEDVALGRVTGQAGDGHLVAAGQEEGCHAVLPVGAQVEQLDLAPHVGRQQVRRPGEDDVGDGAAVRVVVDLDWAPLANVDNVDPTVLARRGARLAVDTEAGGAAGRSLVQPRPRLPEAEDLVLLQPVQVESTARGTRQQGVRVDPGEPGDVTWVLDRGQ